MANISWNWTLKNWPNFTYDKHRLAALEYTFAQRKGMVLGAVKHFRKDSKNELLVEILSNEAMKTSEIEGEFLNRESVQSSIMKNLGLKVDKRKVKPAEHGISEMMVDSYVNYSEPLSHKLLCEWHKMICNGRRDLTDISTYRTHPDPMQVVSGRLDMPKVHFEAPPSKRVPKEMKIFVQWFNNLHFANHELETFPLVKAAITHLYFVSIHPFEDGNGRIGRALVEKSLAISAQQPRLSSLSQVIESNKKSYYDFLENHNKTLEITNWLVYFGNTILDAQEDTLKRIDFLLAKTKFFDQFSNQLNDRQLKVIRSVFDYGPRGFKGGLSASNYRRIAKTSPATATRDLHDLVDKKIMNRKGELKATRYSLNLNELC